jgi:hypothetical protein
MAYSSCACLPNAWSTKVALKKLTPCKPVTRHNVLNSGRVMSYLIKSERALIIYKTATAENANLLEKCKSFKFVQRQVPPAAREESDEQ